MAIYIMILLIGGITVAILYRYRYYSRFAPDEWVCFSYYESVVRIYAPISVYVVGFLAFLLDRTVTYVRRVGT